MLYGSVCRMWLDSDEGEEHWGAEGEFADSVSDTVYTKQHEKVS